MRKQIALFLALMCFSLLAIAQAPAGKKLIVAQEVPGLIDVYQDETHASFTLDGDTILVTVPGFDMSIQERATLTAAYTYGDVLCGCIESNIETSTGEPALWIFWVKESAVVHIPEIGATYFIGSEKELLSVPEPMCHKIYQQNHEMNAGTRTRYTFRD